VARARSKGTVAAPAVMDLRSVEKRIKEICNIMRRSNCAGAMQYVPELSWVLFLRILDEREAEEANAAMVVGAAYTPSLSAPFRWSDWAAPDGAKRKELALGTLGAYFAFVNDQLIPHLKGLKARPNATARQKVISEILSGVERVRVDTEKNFLDVLDKVHEISVSAIDPTHVFTLSQVYETLLLKMGEKGNDGGQFFTPREVIRAVVKVVAPKAGETVYDPGCGTGGFLAQAYDFMYDKLRADGRADAETLDTLKRHTFWGREKENLVYPVALANLVLHGIDQPNIWHGNTLTLNETYGGLFENAPPAYDVILTNPPFGGKEGEDAQTRFAYKTSATQVLFLQLILDSLRNGGRAGVVLDEGLLFKTNEAAYVQTKRKLVEECNLWCVVSLPAGVFSGAGSQAVKTDILFFTKGEPTKEIWYYDLSDVKVTKRQPLTLKHFDDFFEKLPTRAQSERSWVIDFAGLRTAAMEKAAPLQKEARHKQQQAAQWKERLAALKRARPVDEAAVREAEERHAELMVRVRDLDAQATSILNSIYDLKATNPSPVAEPPPPDVPELMFKIDETGRTIAAALAELVH
jgi:type I restriction enzyme M protein